MKNNKITILLILTLMIIPFLKLQAEESGASVGTSTSVESDDKYPLPPVRMPPVVDPSLNSSVDTKSEVEVGDDKGSARTEESASVKADIEARKKSILAAILSIKGDIKVRLETQAQARVKKLLENIWNMLGNQINRLTRVDARIGEKIDALKAKGTDVTVIMTQYTKAQAALAKARVDVEAAYSVSIDETTKATSKEVIRAAVRTAEDSIKTAGKEYMKIIPMLPEENASAEVETQNNSSTKVEQ